MSWAGEMDFRQLRAFVTIADTGNVTRAGQQLNLVQPAVSRQLKLLEEDLGTTLFERERHGMVLTDAGRSLLSYARRVMLELDRARVEILGQAGTISGLVTLGLLPSTADLLASPLYGAVAHAYPGIRLRISTGYAGTLGSWLDSGEIDIALIYRVDGVPGARCTPLVEEPLWIVGPPTAKLRRTRAVALADLPGRPMILPSAPHGIRALVDHACATSGVRLDVAAETNDMHIQKRLAMDGHGWTILPPVAFTGELRRKLVSAAPLAKPGVARTIALATPGSRAVSRHVGAVVEILVGKMARIVHAGTWPGARWIG